MPLLDDCSEKGRYRSKERDCQSPPLYVGYCQKEFSANANIASRVHEAHSESVSASPEVGLPDFAQTIVNQQPHRRCNHHEIECGNDISRCSQSSQSSTSSGFGSGNERDSEIDNGGTTSATTTTSGSTGDSSVTNIKQVRGNWSSNSNHAGSHVGPTNPRNVGDGRAPSISTSSSFSDSFSSFTQTNDSSSITHIKDVIECPPNQSDEFNSDRSSKATCSQGSQSTASDSSSFSNLSLESANSETTNSRNAYISTSAFGHRHQNEQSTEERQPTLTQNDEIVPTVQNKSRNGGISDTDTDIDSRNSHESLPLLPIEENHQNTTDRSMSERDIEVTTFQEDVCVESSESPETFEHSVAGNEKILITVYTEEEPVKVSCEVPRILRRSLTTGNRHYAYDPKNIIDEATDRCNILYYYKPMFGLWQISDNQWIIMSELIRSTENLELRIRFTTPIGLNHHKQRENDVDADSEGESGGTEDETLSAFPPLNNDLLQYLFYQRRHQFRKNFPDSKRHESETKFLRHLLPGGLESNEEEGSYDSVLYLAVFDELRRRVDLTSNQIMAKGYFAKKVEDILPQSMCECFKASRWYSLNKQLQRKIVWERFHHLLGLACDHLKTVKKEFLYIAYINHVEKLDPAVRSEITVLGDDTAAVCINGDRGVVFVTESLSFLELSDVHDNRKCHDGMKLKISDEVNIIELNFSDIADIQVSSIDEKKIFLSDILGNKLVLPFTKNEDRIRFVESVNQYYKLLADHTKDFPCLRDAKLKEKVYVHEMIRAKHLVNALVKHSSKFGCVYRRSQRDNKLDVFIKTVQNDETVIQRSSIEKSGQGQYSLTECDDMLIEAKSVEDFIEQVVTESQRGKLDNVLGKENCKALVKVIKPSTLQPSALLKKRVCKRKRERKEMEQLKDDQFGPVLDVFTGDFTTSMIAKFSGDQNTLLIRNFEMRERQQDIAHELDEAMNLLYAVRHHRHIVRQIGSGVSYDWKVLEYSKWGNLSTYFERRAIRGAEIQDDIMVMTGHWLVQIFYQLALALNYLATKNLAHGGIRAENMLIFQTNPTPCIKLSHPGVRCCRISQTQRDALQNVLRCKPESQIPTLPRPWLAKELGEDLESSEYDSTLEGDVWAFATTIAQIITYANNGKSFEHTWGYLDGCNPTKKAARQYWKRIYEATCDSCDIATVPDWLKYPEESGVRFRDKLTRCWKKAASLRPSIHELLQSISILVHNDVGKDVEIFPRNSDTPSSYKVKFQEIIPTFSDRDLLLVKKLSSGNFGTVSLYEQTSSKRKYAVKDMKNFDHQSMKSFTDELRTMLRLRHENIVQIEGMTIPSQRIVMEYVSGGSLESKFHKIPYFSIHQRISFALDIAKGLQELHRKNILHRDLAARNILLKPKVGCGKEYTAVISDFGLSRVVQSKYYTTASVTVPALWYPPGIECLHASRKTDIWSYGVTLWEMFQKDKPPKVAPLENKPRDCPDKVYKDILLKCWKANPHDRIELREIIDILTELQWRYSS